ncbi:hypothetical protein [Pseudonocardia zijingensis]|uniref:Uncharacterized protein n=1 Tax=Pseudonocardia zijingensis TaxID=153376 RepID=A0ABP3YPP1_9PSEU
MSTTVVRGRWFPASVVLPDGRTLRKTRVILAEGGEHAGMWVYTRPDQVEFHAPINWLQQAEIPTGRRARAGVDVQLTDGTVAVITPGTECKCGQLGRWAGPSWATNVAVRP